MVAPIIAARLEAAFFQVRSSALGKGVDLMASWGVGIRLGIGMGERPGVYPGQLPQIGSVGCVTRRGSGALIRRGERRRLLSFSSSMFIGNRRGDGEVEIEVSIDTVLYSSSDSDS
jgi:hypothetical protein